MSEVLLTSESDDVDGAQQALQKCYEMQKIILATVSARENARRNQHEEVTQQIHDSTPRIRGVISIVDINSDVLKLASSFLRIKSKCYFRMTSLQLHSALMNLDIDLTQARAIRLSSSPTPEYLSLNVLQNFGSFRKFKNSSQGSTLSNNEPTHSLHSLAIGSRLQVPPNQNVDHLLSCGFGMSWNVTGLNFVHEILSGPFKDPKSFDLDTVKAFSPYQIKKICIARNSIHIFDDIGSAVQSGFLLGLREISYVNDDTQYDRDPESMSYSGFGRMSHFGQSFVTLDMSKYQAAVIHLEGIELNAKLHTVNLSGTLSLDYSPLGLCSSLTTLDISDTLIDDLSPLRGCSNLQTLHIEYAKTNLIDLTPLDTSLNLQTLNISNNPHSPFGLLRVTGVQVLGRLRNLHTLNLDGCGVSNISPLSSCICLHTLCLHGNVFVNDVTPLGLCSNLHTLILYNTTVSDVSPLGSCNNLHVLDLSRTPVSDVSGLNSCMSLNTLALCNTRVQIFTALGPCINLRRLYLDNYHLSSQFNDEIYELIRMTTYLRVHHVPFDFRDEGFFLKRGYNSF